jgi:glyoxylase I family protein
MPAPRLTGFTHISLSVADLDRSLAFYRDVIGLPVLAEPYAGTVFDGREAMLLSGSSSALCLQEHAARHLDDIFSPLHPGLDHFAFAVGSDADLQEFATHLSDRGCPHSGVKPLEGFGHFIELRDPDGMLVELHAMGT